MIKYNRGLVFTRVRTFCDTCGKQILYGHEGGVRFFQDGSFRFFHKKDCDETKDGECWEELGGFFTRAMIGLNINPVKEFAAFAQEEDLSVENLEGIIERS